MLLTYEPLLNKHKAVTGCRILAHGEPTDPGEYVDIWPDRNTVLFAPEVPPSATELMAWHIPPNTILELPAQTARDNPLLLVDLIARHVSLALSGVKGGALPDGRFRFVLADPSVPPAALPGVPLVQEPPDGTSFQDCIHAGYAGAAGWFFLNNAPTRGQLAPSHAHILRILNLVREEADIGKIEAALKQDLALSYKLLRFINSVGFGLSCEIHSFRHAVTIMGYQKLQKWLGLLLVTASKHPLAPALVQASIVRGRFMEILGEDFFERAELDNLFITGAFSLLDTLLGVSLSDVLEPMRLPEPVNDALLEGIGLYAPFLSLARACESGDGRELARQVETLGLDPHPVNRALLSALHFAEDMLST